MAKHRLVQVTNRFLDEFDFHLKEKSQVLRKLNLIYVFVPDSELVTV